MEWVTATARHKEEQRKMRVVWINKSPWKKPGPIVYMGLLNALSFAWHGVPTDFFVGAGAPSDTDQDLADYYALESHPALSIHRIDGTKGGRRGVYRAALEKIHQYLASDEPVLVLTREVGVLAPLVRLKKQFPRLKVLHEVHDYYLTTRHLPKPGWSARRRQWAERWLIPCIDGLICLTEAQRALYQQHFSSVPMTVLPLGTLDRSEPEDLERRRLARRLIYIGHLHEYKGLSLIFEIARQLNGHNVELQCLGGDEGQVNALRTRARDAGLAQVLGFEPFRAPADLHAYLAREASVGLVPLQDTFYSRYLTCPVKALDCLTHGLPIVGSDLPSIRELARGAGELCQYNAADQFVAECLALLADAQHYQSRSQASWMRSRELLWRTRAQRILEFVGTAH